MNVSAIVPTRGDIDVQPVLDSLPAEWEVILWTNPHDGLPGKVERWPSGCDERGSEGWVVETVLRDLGPHGRFDAISWANNALIYVQDDDVIVSDPQAIVKAWIEAEWEPPQDNRGQGNGAAHVVCNMPPEFREHYDDSAMVGFGAVFHHRAPQRAFERFWRHMGPANFPSGGYPPWFYRESCRVFTVLTPRVLVDVPKTDREMASDPNRLWKQPDHLDMRAQALRLARAARDA